MATEETSMLSGDPNTVSPSQTQTPTEGSIRSLARKSSDYTWASNRITIDRESYLKNRRYVNLKPSEMYASLVRLYTEAFLSHWSHFKRTADAIVTLNNNPRDSATYLARKYISGWFLDLYDCNREAVRKLSYVALNEHFTHKHPRISNEYDVVLAHLNSVIRPTHVKGCPEDSLYIPNFTEKGTTPVWTNNALHPLNPFEIKDFDYNFSHFKTIITSIKDKRSGWNTAQLSNETVGRPVWLFDWHSQSNCCAWFPRKDNFDSEDVTYAFILGESCTPRQAIQDIDDWQPLPASADLDRIDPTVYRRVKPRQYFGNYEVESYKPYAEFPIDTLSNSLSDSLILTAGSSTVNVNNPPKRIRLDNRAALDTSQPSVINTRAYGDDQAKKTLTMIKRVTYLYYERIIFETTFESRLSMLLGLLTENSS
uniref:Coat protein n=6 Tax=Medicago sativa deltapartitivirus 1 TaxID=2043551 RepID=A0A8K1R8A4_9VIRU|nr:coat protein [Medicago sativa deltapartitivirus 1]UJQ88541.1 MAG: coat protein [Medicago sativa deltapartitivirus 1]UJQ88543.1 MAG: coat protein [Medicago sativa deltapartitivirus 1]USJ75195.1 capsid protein [Medicago sativa deltapartitivirus 1]